MTVKALGRYISGIATDFPTPAAEPSKGGWFAYVWMAALLAVIFVQAYRSGANTPATYDEPLHIAAGMLYHAAGDYRMNPEHPPLFKWLATAGSPPLGADPADRLLGKLSTEPRVQWEWAVSRLMGKGDLGAFERLLAAARRMQLVWLGLLVGGAAVWAGVRGGIWAACLGVALVGLDTTVLAHAPLVTNDVASAGAALGALLCLDMAHRSQVRGRHFWLAGIFVAVTLGICLKATGILVGFSVGVVLLGMVIGDRERWRSWLMTLVLIPVVSVGAIWAEYGFRYSAGPDGETLDFPALVSDIRARKQMAAEQANPLALQIAAWTTEHHLLPEAYVYGLGVQYRISLRSRTFAFGQNYDPAPVWYLPAVLLLKEPITWLVIVGAGGIWGGIALLRRKEKMPAWVIAWLLLVLIFALSGKGRGARYLLPVSVPAAVAAGFACTNSNKGRVGRPGLVRGVAVLCPVLLLAEGVSLPAPGFKSPPYLTYFNVASKLLGPKHCLLGDSNLDWGQTYESMGQFAASSESTGPVYWAAFGTLEPKGIGTPIVPGFFLSAPPTMRLGDLAKPERKGVLLVSATMWQGTYLSDEIRAEYLRLQQLRPDEILDDGALLLYRLPLRLPADH